MTELTVSTNPSPSPIPKPNGPHESHEPKDQTSLNKHPKLLKPKYRLHSETLRHPATTTFNRLLPDVSSTLDKALDNIIKYLYTPPHVAKSDPPPKTQRPYFHPSIPPTRSVTVFLRDFGGVAYTTGTEIDDDHKEIHISLQYLQHITKGASAKKDPLHEIIGFLTHELVHCYQHSKPEDDGSGRDIPQPPGGLIEGIADFVRLKAGLEPPHWKKPLSSADRAAKWDAGYQNTAYFLAWIEDVWVGEGAIGMLNDRLLRVGYIGEDEDGGEDDDVKDDEQPGFWVGLFGIGVADLWDEYGRYLDGDAQVRTKHVSD